MDSAPNASAARAASGISVSVVCDPAINYAFQQNSIPVLREVRIANAGAAAEILREQTGRAALNGYQDRSRERAWQQVDAIVQAIGRQRIRYINPPASFEETGQKVRFPTEILEQRFATCLDLALLFAACCEQAGLHPLVLMHEGHAYAGCWVVGRTLAEPATDDQQLVRKLVDLEELAVCELTALTTDSPGTLANAERLARRHLEPDVPFRLALSTATGCCGRRCCWSRSS